MHHLPVGRLHAEREKKSTVKPRLYFCLLFCGITAVLGGTGSGVNVTVPFENNHACFVLSSSLQFGDEVAL